MNGQKNHKHHHNKQANLKNVHFSELIQIGTLRSCLLGGLDIILLHSVCAASSMLLKEQYTSFRQGHLPSQSGDGKE